MVRSNITILNVDDNEAGLYLKSKILRHAGYGVIEATTGGEVLQLVESARPQLVLLDVKLPDVNGLEVCRRIKTNPETASMLVLQISASCLGGPDKVLALEGGADGYLTEPIAPEELLANVKALLRLRETEAALRESEARLRLAIDGARIGIWEWEIPARRLSWGGHTESLLGLAPGGFAGTYKAFLQQIHPADRRMVKREMTSAFEQERNHSVEFRVVWPDRSLHWLAAESRVFRDEQGRTLRMNGVVRDITAHKESELERARCHEQEQLAREAAEAATRAKDEFLALVSHELRAPLNAVLGWTQILQQKRSDHDTVQHALEVIERNTRMQMQLVEDLLDISRIVTGKLRLEIRPFDLASVIEKACDNSRPAAAARGVELRLALDPQSRHLEGDPDRLQQVVWNLLSNSIKFTPSGGRVELRLEYGDSEARLTVSDNGQGIDPKFLPRIFDRFSQGDSTVSPRQSGLGLGLALVRRLVELHGGNVSVVSPGCGQGATFTVTLPLKSDGIWQPAAEIQDRFRGWELDLEAVPAGLRLDGVLVLIVGAEAGKYDLIKAVLERYGARISIVSDPDEAIKVFVSESTTIAETSRVAETSSKGSPAEALVVDVGSLGEDGYRLVEQLRQMVPVLGGKIPAIALTSQGAVEDRLRVLKSGFQMHLAQPVEPAELLTVIASLTARLE
ncbi:MAG TPA: ATP-binding protein [Blastocatellia bacterium]|nr:ATP-binding protein [Blastocatellia bacterium]